MVTKKFVSIYFTSKGIQIVQLSKGNQKIKFASRFDLPPGIIVDQKVKDQGSLTKILVEIWKKQKIKEKSVSVVVPEFSTFTKTLKLPHLEVDELDEAVRWQAQEFLPWTEDETILDWKIISENEIEVIVQLVAINKKVLAGFVDSVGDAGLFPVAVETPSMSILRLSETKTVGKILVYVGRYKSLVVIASGEQINGSSVHPVDELDDLLQTTAEMLKHYKDVNIESVEVGGQGITDQVILKFEKSFGVKPTVLGNKLRKIPKQTLHQYLIPMSLQLKDPAEPADMFTINLIPSNWVEEYEQKKLKLQIWSVTLLVSYIVWITFFAALASYLFMSQQVETLKVQHGVLNKTEPEAADIITEVNNINSMSSKVIAINSVSYYPQTIMNEIYDAKPETVSLFKYYLDLDQGIVEVTGISEDRSSLLVFKNSLEENEKFSIVDIPVSALETEKDIEFTLQFGYLPISATIKKK